MAFIIDSTNSHPQPLYIWCIYGRLTFGWCGCQFDYARFSSKSEIVYRHVVLWLCNMRRISKLTPIPNTHAIYVQMINILAATLQISDRRNWVILTNNITFDLWYWSQELSFPSRAFCLPVSSLSPSTRYSRWRELYYQIIRGWPEKC